ncbi:hypothetical protein [Advenella mimigardefordensis]|uniref:hypothetical protein n=1 Tax=Advenella mimigardefordensis TaxID=302406 RepID=UPI00130E9F91|nr:hypothetical protein [Advenella mimigardefordensis]
MKKFRHGFLVGAVLVFCIPQIPFIGPMLLRHLGPCYHPTPTQVRKLIMASAMLPNKLKYQDTEPYDGVELTWEDGSDTVYTTRQGKRVGRHFPMVSCGYLEWAHDQTFVPER